MTMGEAIKRGYSEIEFKGNQVVDEKAAVEASFVDPGKSRENENFTKEVARAIHGVHQRASKEIKKEAEKSQNWTKSRKKNTIDKHKGRWNLSVPKRADDRA